MGHNLISACHKCRVKIFHFRNEENEAILPFYKKHVKCSKRSLENVITFMDNQGNEPVWYDMDTYEDDDLQTS